jgi:hypothetical protein
MTTARFMDTTPAKLTLIVTLLLSTSVMAKDKHGKVVTDKIVSKSYMIIW